MPDDKRQWPRSPLLGQIVLVTTVDLEGRVDIAPKSWISMAAFDPPMVGFGCHTGHRTHANLATTGARVSACC